MQRKKYNREYKLETVKLSYERGSITELAQELGLRPELIYRWRSEFEATSENSFPGNGRRTEPEDELSRLRKENQELRLERDILKKAVVIFSKPTQ
ncbi:MAG: transposase [Bacteroidetes bacterium]|nr:transposase [Bacteroidota bacterium]